MLLRTHVVTLLAVTTDDGGTVVRGPQASAGMIPPSIAVISTTRGLERAIEPEIRGKSGTVTGWGSGSGFDEEHTRSVRGRARYDHCKMRGRGGVVCVVLLAAGCGGRTEPLVGEQSADRDASATDSTVDVVADLADVADVVVVPLDDGRIPRCGDGIRDPGEACDDGNTIDDDLCDNACRTPVCGDGKRAGTEQCDLGKDNGDRPAFLISQPSGTHIGTNPLVRPKSSTAFYDYFSASSHTGLEQVSESRIYLYVDSATGRLSLILTHGIDFDTTGLVQPASTVDMEIAGLPAGFAIDLADDDKSEFFATGPSTAVGRWKFNRNSDGGVLGGLPFPGVWKVTVTPHFVAGISTWGWVKHDTVRIPLIMTETITIQAFDVSTSCRTNCTIPRCGDGILDGGEVCDDGNVVGGDGCAADCKSLR